jgi:hypothetical protein
MRDDPEHNARHAAEIAKVTASFGLHPTDPGCQKYVWFPPGNILDGMIARLPVITDLSANSVDPRMVFEALMRQAYEAGRRDMQRQLRNVLGITDANSPV